MGRSQEGPKGPTEDVPPRRRQGRQPPRTGGPPSSPDLVPELLGRTEDHLQDGGVSRLLSACVLDGCQLQGTAVSTNHVLGTHVSCR